MDPKGLPTGPPAFPGQLQPQLLATLYPLYLQNLLEVFMSLTAAGKILGGLESGEPAIPAMDAVVWSAPKSLGLL